MNAYAAGAVVTAAAAWRALGRAKRRCIAESDGDGDAALRDARATVATMLRDGVVIADVDGATRKLAAINRGGGAAFTAVLDFDRTLTTAESASAHGVVATALPESFQKKEAALKAKYYPIECDLGMPLDEKIPLMREWYCANHDLTLAEGLERAALAAAVKEAARKKVFRLRDGVAELLDLLESLNGRARILSAGIEDVVRLAIAEMYDGALPADLAITANRMRWDGETLAGYSEPLIHMYNKKQNGGKLENVLLVGDSLGDATMADGADAGPTCVFKVGYLNRPKPDGAAVAKYAAAFDAVVLDEKDASFNVPLAICAAALHPCAAALR